ncbi:DMT family transporter [Microbacterium laevaniformans]|uniref:DMT family transporter n=1 Tax=Microbacterium laevaniformans TaxID=36807 RepID=UPI001958F1F2|nr:DMT family transporter [Microbacterium laevaniformans]MBM7753257.1 drug/metabolite transporter (DMT)-like permease [Microbacterium laevaniformans]GLJ65374.1 membrane protein [Microbacterium laevaniformans]
MAPAVSGRAWALYALMAVLWGIPYLFIKEAVDSLTPAAVVAGRTLLGAAVLLPIALRRRALRPALALWPWVLAFGAIEMAGPFLLLGHAEQTLPSGLTGLLVATVPLFATGIALVRGDRSALSPARAVGLVVGFAGLVVIVAGPGLAVAEPAQALGAIAQVLLVALLYAIAPFIIATKLAQVPSLGTITLSLVAVGLAYLPFALLTQHELPTVRSGLSLVALGILCTALAFLGFFALIGEVGPVRAPLFTYVNPVVAILLGVLLLGEPLSPGLLLGFPLVLIGCWFAATGGRLRLRRQAPPYAP